MAHWATLCWPWRRLRNKQRFTVSGWHDSNAIPRVPALGLDLSDCYFGTLNLDFAPLEVSLSNPDHLFEKVQWTDLHPPETFSFWSVQIKTPQSEVVNGWIYYPHPETKLRHWQPPTTLELLAPRLCGVEAGCTIHLCDQGQRIKLMWIRFACAQGCWNFSNSEFWLRSKHFLKLTPC